MKRTNLKRATILMGVLAFLTAVALYAGERHGNVGGMRDGGGGSGRSMSMGSRQPMTIHMNHSRGDNGSFRSSQPSYGQIHWNHTTTRQRSVVPAQRVQATRQLNTVRVAGVRNANVMHHHAYAQGYVRQKLSKIGVKSEPRHITDRSEIVSSDRAHSIINYPQTGPKGAAIKGSVVSVRQFNNAGVRAQMRVVNRPAFTAQIGRENANETQRGRTYWHSGNGFNYAHYIDNSGYHWYGFYSGSQYFWTRNYAGRWWWYDTGFNRWCFYNDNYWWWQDPYHVGDLYCYDDDSYVPVNSADDQIVATGAQEANETTYNSSDGTRMVKVVQADGDAFLYDAAAAPSFDPIYLASGVQSVQFSDASNGRPLEIVVTLSDGSFDLFGANGQSYSTDSSEAN